MSEIRFITEDEMPHFVDIAFHAYPKIFDPCEGNRIKVLKRFIDTQTLNPSQNFYGFYRDKQMLGGMQLHDFTMKLLSTKIPLGGVGSVAVDFLHKKQNICKELITYFLHHYRDLGYGMVALYPFRPDFYKKMGFGYGGKINRYQTKPAFLPADKTDLQQLMYLNREDVHDMVKCHNELVAQTHGMIEKTAIMMGKTFDDLENRVVAYKEDGKILAYLVYRFISDDDHRFLIYDMYIQEIIYQDTRTLKILLTFLHQQADQVRDIMIDTHDEYFHYLLKDPRNGSNNFIATLSHESNLQALGLMYRIINVSELFNSLQNHNFGGQNCILKLSIHDDLLECNNTNITLQFQNGIATIKKNKDYDVEISLGISEFSSLLMGTVTFKALHLYGLATISKEEYLEIINKIFITDEKPKCTVRF